jgi:hypothetical protein
MKADSPQKAQTRTQKAQSSWKAGLNPKEFLRSLCSYLRFLWSLSAL